MRGIWLVSPFFGEDVLDAPITAASACEALHGNSTGCPYHAFSLAIPVEFNAFLTLSMPSSIGDFAHLVEKFMRDFEGDAEPVSRPAGPKALVL